MISSTNMFYLICVRSPDGLRVFVPDSTNGGLYAYDTRSGNLSMIYSGAPLQVPTALLPTAYGDVIVADQVRSML